MAEENLNPPAANEGGGDGNTSSVNGSSFTGQGENDSSEGGDEKNSRADADGAYRALKIERQNRKDLQRQLKEMQAQLDRFANVNPDEYAKLQEENAEAARMQEQWGEVREAMENKYSSQAQEAIARAEKASEDLAMYKKHYALEKVFNSAGGRLDANNGTSFFDMFAERVGGSFRQEDNGSLTVVDQAGDPIINKETGKRVTPEEYISSYKNDPVFGTFFKGAKGSGAGIGFAGTDANGMPADDFNSLPAEEKFLAAFK